MSSITKENLMHTLPSVLQEDANMKALASAVADELATLAQAPAYASVYTRIDNLPMEILDALAVDYKIDWWRPDSSIEEKRRILKLSWYVHKHLGTKSAVETAVADFLGAGKVEEWSEYNGKPHHFRIVHADSTAINERYDIFMKVLQAVQRGSSVLDAISALFQHEQHISVGFSMRVSKKISYASTPVDDLILAMLGNEDAIIITDEHGNVLIDEADNIFAE